MHREWEMVETAPTHDPRGSNRRHLRVYTDKSGQPYVRMGKGARMKRYLDAMAYAVIDRKMDMRIYFETWPDLPARPDLVRPEYIRQVSA